MMLLVEQKPECLAIVLRFAVKENQADDCLKDTENLGNEHGTKFLIAIPKKLSFVWNTQETTSCHTFMRERAETFSISTRSLFGNARYTTIPY
jgi:hypothetical protein